MVLGDVALTKSLCDAGADPSGDVRWHYHDTYLMVATDLGHMDVARALLDRGARIDGIDDLGDRALMRAASAGRVDFAAMLLDRGADLDESNWAWVRPLSIAAIHGHRVVVELFLQRGTKRDLLDAVALDDVPLLRTLLENSRVRHGIPDYPDRSSYAPVGRPAMYAASRGNVEMVKLLLQHGAELNSLSWKSDDHSLLAEAARHGHLPLVRLLIEAGADLEAVGQDELTALEWAVRGGQDEVFRYLREAGAKDRSAGG